ncbi:SDR family NAD(P)-dependent oxidoreductase [Mycobacterium sp.]|uniref:SDR family NAD(P)-dependent oxidoreductase n=1 Tax=Mycobacterium sp. TaxID=1785 RepID=UPI003C70E2B2
MTSLQGKVVFITGGARGIGAEVARRLRDKGAKLVLVDLGNDELAALAAELVDEDRVLTVVADVRDLPALQAAAEKAVCVAAFVEGIEKRQDRVYCPGWVAAFRWLKPFLPRLGGSPVRKAAVEVVAQMDDQLAALGRSTSAYNESVVKRPD